MLEPPDLDLAQLRSFLEMEYGRRFRSIEFLPLGADVDTAVFRAATSDASFFLKLRSGPFSAVTVLAPYYLHGAGVSHLIPPVPTRSGRLWLKHESFVVVLYPFVRGRNGNVQALTGDQWTALGATLAGLHQTALPASMRAAVASENFSPYWRNPVLEFQAKVQTQVYGEAAAAALAALLREKEAVVSDLVKRTDRLGAILKDSDLPYVPCHGDIQAWNVLVSDAGELYVVDWDTLILAPKERDLMFIGAGLGWQGENAETEAQFYRGYGPTEANAVALAYYRYERIIEDIAAYCDQLLERTDGGADRWEAVRQISSQFQPGDVIDFAYRTDRVDPMVYAASDR